MGISEVLVRLLSNAGIMVAASAFIATVNQDVFRQIPPKLGGLGPRIRAYDSWLSNWIRSFTVIVGIILMLMIGAFSLISLNRVEEWFDGIEHSILLGQIFYYGFLSLILTLTCFLRIKGPDND